MLNNKVIKLLLKTVPMVPIVFDTIILDADRRTDWVGKLSYTDVHMLILLLRIDVGNDKKIFFFVDI